MDVKIIFLNEELEEEVYMIKSESFTSIDESKVCKLQRSIYGLKQESKSWNIHFDKIIRTYGFIRNGEEPCIYIWVSNFMIVYVDDIFLIKNDIPAL